MSQHYSEIFQHRLVTADNSVFEHKPSHEILKNLNGKAVFDALQLRDKTVSMVDILAFYMKRDPKAMPYRVLDIGTGEGWIPILLEEQLKNTSVEVKEYHGIENDVDALFTARKNSNTRKSRLCVYEADMLEHRVSIIGSRATGDNVILSANLPYNTEAEWETYPEAVKAEPKHAIVSWWEDGLDHYRELIRQLQPHIDQIHMLIFQGSSYRITQLYELCKQLVAPGMKFYIESDCYGKDRFVLGVRSELHEFESPVL